MIPIAQIAWKDIAVHAPFPRATPDQLRAYLRRAPTYKTLRQLGEFFSTHLWKQTAVDLGGNTFVSRHMVPYLALLAIEGSNDFRGPKELSWPELRHAFEMFLGIEPPTAAALGKGESDDAFSYLLQTSQQFDLQADVKYLLPRVLAIFRDLWPTVPQAASIVPLDDLRAETGLSLEQVVAFGWAFTNQNKGYCRPFESVTLANEHFTAEGQERFLAWVSADYETIRRIAAQKRNDLGSDPSLDPYRFNPLTVFPLVRPSVNPDPPKPLYLLPCNRLLLERAHTGLFHVLADRHRGEGAGENPFRRAFGYVVQAYVGVLLKEALGPAAVHAERKFGPAGTLDSTDWIVVEDEDCGVLLEVKVSALTFATRALGDVAQAKQDLRKKLVKAVKQIAATEAAIDARASGLEDFRSVKSFEHLVVIYESLSWANSFIRDLIRTEVPDAAHFHVITVSELEHFVAHCADEGFAGMLRRKRLAPDGGDAADFHDWIARDAIARNERRENPFLARKFHDAIGELTSE